MKITVTCLKNKMVSSLVLKGLERILIWYLREKAVAKALGSQHEIRDCFQPLLHGSL